MELRAAGVGKEVEEGPEIPLCASAAEAFFVRAAEPVGVAVDETLPGDVGSLRAVCPCCCAMLLSDVACAGGAT